MKNIVLRDGESLGCLAIIGGIVVLAVAAAIGPGYIVAAIFGLFVLAYAGLGALLGVQNVTKWTFGKIVAAYRRPHVEKRRQLLLQVIEKYGTEIRKERVKQGFENLENDACAAIEPVILAPLRDAGLKPIEGVGKDLDPTEVGDAEFELISTLGIAIAAAMVAAIYFDQRDLNGWMPWIYGAPILVLLVASIVVATARNRWNYRVTSRRVIAEYGLVMKDTTEIRVQDIRSINVSKSGPAGIIWSGEGGILLGGDR